MGASYAELPSPVQPYATATDTIDTHAWVPRIQSSDTQRKYSTAHTEQPGKITKGLLHKSSLNKNTLQRTLDEERTFVELIHLF
jgi:hypothetical protein